MITGIICLIALAKYKMTRRRKCLQVLVFDRYILCIQQFNCSGKPWETLKQRRKKGSKNIFLMNLILIITFQEYTQISKLGNDYKI